MRTEQACSEYVAWLGRKYIDKCKDCAGRDPACQCYQKVKVYGAAYEACIPQDFWDIDPSEIKHNKHVFDTVISKYVDNLKTALMKGYGLLFTGDNGVGKTYFMSYVLIEAIKRGRTVYYTTMPDLDYNIKRGMDDSRLRDRLDWYLTSDFVAIDEMGKERAKSSNAYIDAQVERIMKRRLDDSGPMLLSTNTGQSEMEEAYGRTVASMLSGKFRSVTMVPGDFRHNIQKRMNEEMGY